VDKLNLQFVLLREFSAQAPHRGHQAESVELGWVQLVGQVVDVGGNFRGYFRNAVQLLSSLGRKRGGVLLPKLFEPDLQERHPLTEIGV